MLWHVAQTEAFMGAVAERSLAAKSDKLDAGWQVFHPIVQDVHRGARGRARTTERPYFPGYIFVGVDDPNDWRHVNYARGIKDKGIMLAAQDVPARLGTEVIDRLVGRCEARMVRMPGDTKERLRHFIRQDEADEFVFRLGQIVRVLEGPLTGFKGPVKEATRNKVLVDLLVFGRPTPTAAAPRQLEPV